MIASLLASIPDWIEALSLIVAAASLIAATTPTPKDNSIVASIYKVVDFLAINFGKAKDK
tara:strand:+ start:259 stop:438 length:180 start_codon:yes stop_codon:yes gene_type:complete